MLSMYTYSSGICVCVCMDSGKQKENKRKERKIDIQYVDAAVVRLAVWSAVLAIFGTLWKLEERVGADADKLLSLIIMTKIWCAVLLALVVLAAATSRYDEVVN